MNDRKRFAPASRNGSRRTVRPVLAALALSVPALLCAAASGTGAQMKLKEGLAFKTPVEQHTLKNGLDVVFCNFDTPGVVAYWTVVRAGSRNEIEPGKTGYAHLFEHLMFRGTTTYPQAKYNEVMDLHGADHNAFTGLDWTVYNSVFPAEHLPKMIEIQADRFQNLTYDEEAYVQETGAVLGEYNIGRADPSSILEETLYKTAFDFHTYRHTVIGWESDVRAMPEGYDYGRKFFERYYRPDNCAIIVVGDFDRERTLSRIITAYQRWPAGAEPRLPEQEPPQTEPRFAEIPWEGPASPMIVVGFKVPGWNLAEPDDVALLILKEIAFGRTSDFHRKWVEESLRALSVDVGVPQTLDPGLFTVKVTLKDARDFDEVRADVLQTLARYAAAPPPASETIPAQNYLRYAKLAELESAGGVAYFLSQIYLWMEDITKVHHYFQWCWVVKPQDVQQVAADYMIESNSTTVTLVPGEGS